MSFNLKTNHQNPPFNTMIFEEFFNDKFTGGDYKFEREYLPVNWTNYYISKNYANGDMSELNDYLDNLDKTKKYFTICQWDDGVRYIPEGLDLFVFSSGGVGDYTIPLNCLIPPTTIKEENRNILASFLGKITDRHPIRMKMYYDLGKHNEFIIAEPNNYFYNVFAELMKKSIFSLCPRGYGKTSFRLCESLYYGSIPVYIYDEPWLPFADMIQFEDYGVLCHESEISSLYQKLKSMDNNKISLYRQNGKIIFEEYFSYKGCFDKILKKLEFI